MIETGDDQRFVISSEDGAMETRNIQIGGQGMSIRLEASYWAALEDIGAREEMTLLEILDDVHFRLKSQRLASPNQGVRSSASLLSNAARVFVVGYFRQAALGSLHRGRVEGHPNGAPLAAVESEDTKS